jgi:hypothetical protein
VSVSPRVLSSLEAARFRLAVADYDIDDTDNETAVLLAFEPLSEKMMEKRGRKKEESYFFSM